MIEPLVVLVPAYNAEPSLAKVVKDVRRNLPRAWIIGIDDGSTDGSRQLLRTVCDDTIEFDKNRGKGHAIRSAGMPRCPVISPSRSGWESANLPREGSMSPRRAASFRTRLPSARRGEGHSTP